MLHWTLTFLVVALIAGVLGFSGIAGTAGKPPSTSGPSAFTFFIRG